jgi:predicted metal-dependent HD superfamily phosphohydrolase
VVSPERLDLMQRQWAGLLGGYGVAPADAYPAFDRLVAAYSEPHRHYHTLEHLAEMFRVVGRLGGSGTVHLAVWFHDAVYDPRAKDNEARSADLAVRELTALGLPADVVGEVRRLVLATDHGKPSPTIDGPMAVLLDADLAILGASEARYQRYAADIRKEYAWVPEDIYRTGRASVLRHFLDMRSIYRTQLMIEEGELAARRNLQAELASLTS